MLSCVGYVSVFHTAKLEIKDLIFRKPRLGSFWDVESAALPAVCSR